MLQDVFGGSKDEDDLPGEEWREIELKHFKKVRPFYKYMISNYARVKESSNGGKTYHLADISYLKQGEVRNEFVILYCITLSNPPKILEDYRESVKELFDGVFPELINSGEYYRRFLEAKERIKIKQKTTNGERKYNYYTYNVYNKIIKYYSKLEDISEDLGLSETDINRLLKNKIPPLNNIKIYEVT